MNSTVGWGLAVAGVAMAWLGYGWQGVVFAVTLVVFWLLLQFSRALRVMKNAASAPKGSIDSAVMINAKLQRGMTLMQVVALTRSLGHRVSESPESWAWRDEGGSTVVLVFDGAKLSSWSLARPEAPAA